MPLSEFEIQKISEIVAGKVGSKLDAKQLRRVIDTVVDRLQEQQANPEIEGVTCEVSSTESSPLPPEAEVEQAIEEVVQEETLTEDETTEKGGLYEEIERTDKNRIIVAAFGKNRPGVVAAITQVLAELNCSIEDISQTLMQEFFSMIMVVNISYCPIEFDALRDKIKETESLLGMKVYVMHEDIFSYMHRI
jgi:ACT domain-containing protein